jgi:hypothetical protein
MVLAPQSPSIPSSNQRNHRLEFFGTYVVGILHILKRGQQHVASCTGIRLAYSILKLKYAWSWAEKFAENAGKVTETGLGCDGGHMEHTRRSAAPVGKSRIHS